MQDIQEHERRLASALARIGAAVERLVEAPPAAQLAAEPEADSAAEVEIIRLTRALEAKQAETAALQNQIAHLQSERADDANAAVAELSAGRKLIAEQGIELQRLRRVNLQLRDALRGLREALEGGVADAAGINLALAAELEAMRTARQIDASEIDLLLDALEPLVADAEAQREASNAGDRAEREE